ncbi:MAG: type II toxin-antitoxin system Phd/YefM family antitoxin [Planctomycetes bacterium]|nr:type II toxin-antitoxin system Phd/YefM family antitoxin [Planctomycetota bacterium]
MKSFPASALRNSTADVLENVLISGAVVITRHEKDKAVILSIEAFRRLAEARYDELAALRAKFGGLLAKMQTPAARKGLRDAFEASPAEMGKAAAKAAKRRG